MSSTLRNTLRGGLGLMALVGLVGLTVGWTAAAPDGEPGAQEAEVYTGTLAPLEDSGVEGPVNVQWKGERLSVRVNARNLSPGVHQQHIHGGATCDDFGEVVVPLDSNLGDLGAGDFPATEGESGVLTYNGKGSNEEFVNLELADMTVVVHDLDGNAVACAELERKGGGQDG